MFLTATVLIISTCLGLNGPKTNVPLAWQPTINFQSTSDREIWLMGQTSQVSTSEKEKTS